MRWSNTTNCGYPEEYNYKNLPDDVQAITENIWHEILKIKSEFPHDIIILKDGLIKHELQDIKISIEKQAQLEFNIGNLNPYYWNKLTSEQQKTLTIYLDNLQNVIAGKKNKLPAKPDFIKDKQ